MFRWRRKEAVDPERNADSSIQQTDVRRTCSTGAAGDRRDGCFITAPVATVPLARFIAFLRRQQIDPVRRFNVSPITLGHFEDTLIPSQSLGTVY